MLFKDFLDIIVAIFAAFGVYCAVNMLCDIIILKLKIRREDKENQKDEQISDNFTEESENKDE